MDIICNMFEKLSFLYNTKDISDGNKYNIIPTTKPINNENNKLYEKICLHFFMFFVLKDAEKAVNTQLDMAIEAKLGIVINGKMYALIDVYVWIIWL